MNLFAAVIETFSTGNEVEPTEASPVAESVTERDWSDKPDEHVTKAFQMGKALHDEKVEPHRKEKKRLLAEIEAETLIIEEAASFDIESADEGMSRDDLTDQLLKLETAARISKQIREKKKLELASVQKDIDRLEEAHRRQRSQLTSTAERLAKSRRIAVSEYSRDGLHDYRLNQDRIIWELNLVRNCRQFLLNYCDCPETAEKAIDEICAIGLPRDSRVLWWSVLSQRNKDEHPDHNPKIINDEVTPHE